MNTPILFAYRSPDGDIRVWCVYCGRWHTHGNLAADAPIGAANGHRVCHCIAEDSPYHATGYYILELPSPPLGGTPKGIRVRYTRYGEIVSGYLRMLRKRADHA